MARVCSLFSGSKGNSTYVACGGGGILVDAGVSARALDFALMQREIDPKTIRAILITHEHGDHISGVRVFASRHGIPVYASQGTLEAMEEMGCLDKVQAHVLDDCAAEMGGMQVHSFPISHDCRQPTGYVITLPDERKVAVCTDLGYVSHQVREALSGCDLIVMESNHDVRMLQNGPYPYPLKRRILGSSGHLSNEHCAQALAEFVKQGTTRIILAHLSDENNYPDLALQTSRVALQEEGMQEGVDFLLSAAQPQGGELMVF